MDYYYRDILRLDWGFGNPNVTAALIAILAVATLGAGLVWRKTYWYALPLTAALMVAMIHTLSRGGLVAFIAGVVALFVAIRPKLSRASLISMGLSALFLVVYTQQIGASGRYIQGINGSEDRAISNRWLIYKNVPKMIADAPQGWGKGNATDAYHQWYQPEGRSESYLNLVNSHFTWLVEWPWWARFLYGMGWTMILLALWPSGESKASGISLAVWVAFFVAASFSSVAHRPWMWALPAVVLIAALIPRLKRRRGISRNTLLVGSLVPISAYASVYIAAPILAEPTLIHHADGMTIIGSTKASKTIALVGIDNKILGERYGHRIREFVGSHSNTNVTVYHSEMPLGQSFNQIVMVGNTHERFNTFPASQIFLLNPTQPVKNHDLSKSISTTVIWGSFNPSPAWYAWLAESEKNQQLQIVKIVGEGLYLESWLNEIN